VIRAALGAAFLSSALSAAAGAQGVSIRLGAVRATYADSITGTAAAIGIHGVYERGALRAGADFTQAWFANAAGASTQAGANAALFRQFSPTSGAGVRAAGGLNLLEGGVTAGSAAADLFGALLRGRWLAAASLAGGGVRTVDGVTHPVATASLLVRRELGLVTLETRAAATSSGASRFADLSLGAELERGRLKLGGTLGRRWGDFGGAYYPQVHAELALVPAATLEASAGSYPRDLTGFTSGRFVNVGIRMRVAQPRRAPGGAVHTERAGTGATRVTFTVVGAQSVAIAGEWNEWQPAELVAVAPGRWQAVLPVVRGAFRFALVVNGERWIVPPGVPKMPDGFGGEVGVLVIDG
jgi:hypothetical protein